MTQRTLYGLLLALLLAVSGIVSAQQPDTDTSTPVPLPQMTMLAADDPVEATLGAETTGRLYGFVATEGDTIRIDMTQADEGSSLDPYLVLLDSTGAVLASDDDSGETFLAARLDDIEIPADGSYYVLASSLLFIEGSQLDVTDDLPYTLTLSGNTPPDDLTESTGSDSDDPVLTLDAPRLTVDERPAADITPEQPARFYVIEGEANQRITVQVVSEQFATVLNLFDPAGNRTAFDPSALTAFELPDDGMYLLMVADLFFYEAGNDGTFFTGGAYELFFSSP
jgi:hypothetical protein